jgi:hypothetical protein
VAAASTLWLLQSRHVHGGHPMQGPLSQPQSACSAHTMPQARQPPIHTASWCPTAATRACLRTNTAAAAAAAAAATRLGCPHTQLELGSHTLLYTLIATRHTQKHANQSNEFAPLSGAVQACMVCLVAQAAPQGLGRRAALHSTAQAHAAPTHKHTT